MKLNSNHEIYQLSETVDWAYLETEMGKLFKSGDKAKHRLMAGLIYLKRMSGLSSKEVFSKWTSCPYWRFFCGVESTGTAEKLPFSPVVLDIWEREMSGAGNEIMIIALSKATLVKTAAISAYH